MADLPDTMYCSTDEEPEDNEDPFVVYTQLNILGIVRNREPTKEVNIK